MIRRFVYLLLVAVTLQLSWGAVSAYCEHESGRAARHFGHHQHADAQVADASHPAGDHADDHAGSPAKDTHGGAAKSKAHTHCSSCSHGTLAAVMLDAGPSGERPGSVVAPTFQLHIQSTSPTPPERPKWLHAA